MKFNNMIKLLPLFTTLLLIIFLSISNKKDEAKLKLLIWNTPSLSLGTYIGISTGAGFILSFVITTNLAKIYQIDKKKSLNYKSYDNNEEDIDDSENGIKPVYDNTLFQRDINEPSPTINASFRIIGNINRTNSSFINKNNNDGYTQNDYDDLDEFEEKSNDTGTVNEIYNQNSLDSTDWNDQSYMNW